MWCSITEGKARGETATQAFTKWLQVCYWAWQNELFSQATGIPKRL